MVENVFIGLRQRTGLMKLICCSIKYTKDRDDVIRLILLNKTIRYTRQQAEMLIHEDGTIIAHNSSTCQIFGYDEIFLKMMKICNLKQLLNYRTKNLKISSERLKVFQVKRAKSKSQYHDPKDQETGFQTSKQEMIFNMRAFKSQVMGANAYFVRIWNHDQKGFLEVLQKQKSQGEMIIKSSRRIEKPGEKQSFKKKLFKTFKTKMEEKSFSFFVTEDVEYEGKFVAYKTGAELMNTFKIFSNKVLNVGKFLQKMTYSSPRLLQKPEKIDYAEGIRTKRLLNGNFLEWNPDWEEMESDDDEKDEAELKEKKRKFFQMIKQRKMSELFISNNKLKRKKVEAVGKIKDKKSLEQKIRNKRPGMLIKFIIALNLSLFFCYSIFEYYDHRNRINLTHNLSHYTEISYGLNFASADLFDIMTRLNDLSNINNGSGIFNNLPSEINEKDLVDSCFGTLKKAFESFEDHVDSVENHLLLVDVDDVFVKRYREKNIEIKFKHSSKTHSLNSALGQLKAMLLKVIHLDKEKINFEDENYEFLLKNLNGDFRKKYKEFSTFVENIKSTVIDIDDKAQSTYFTFTILSCILFYALFYCFFSCFLIQRETKVFSYFTFGQRQIYNLIKQNERCLSNLQTKRLLNYNDYFFDTFNEENEKRKKSGQNEQFFHERYHSAFVKKKKKKGTLNPICSPMKLFFLLMIIAIGLWLVYVKIKQKKTVEIFLEIIYSINKISEAELNSYSVLNTLQLEMLGIEKQYLDKPVEYYRKEYVEKLLDLYDDSTSVKKFIYLFFFIGNGVKFQKN